MIWFDVAGLDWRIVRTRAPEFIIECEDGNVWKNNDGTTRIYFSEEEAAQELDGGRLTRKARGGAAGKTILEMKIKGRDVVIEYDDGDSIVIHGRDDGVLIETVE